MPQPQGELYPIETIIIKPSQPGSAPRVSYETISSEFLVQGNFKNSQFFSRALELTGLELSNSRTQSERRIDWANLTAVKCLFFL